MTSDPLVSVVMPVYNGERYVAASVASALTNQDVPLELLLLDDGSTDASVDRALETAAGDPRLRVIHLSHAGVGAARAAALDAARGTYIANLDSDDLAFPRRFARQVAFLERARDHAAVGSRVLVIDGDGRPVRVIGRWFTHEEIDDAHLRGRAGAFANPAAMFRRDAAIAAGGFDGAFTSIGEDVDFWLRVAEHGRLANLPDVLTAYRMHGGNVSLTTARQEDRQAVVRTIVERAFIRRGLRGSPVMGDAAPLAHWESATNEGLLRFFRDGRTAAIVPALRGFILRPGAATWSALRMLLSPASSNAGMTRISSSLSTLVGP